MSAVFKGEGSKRAYQHIKCDAPDCPEISPPASVLLEKHGLINMGWHCAGGTHYCPAHKDMGTRA